MQRRRASTEILVIDAYRQSRAAGLDEWTACEAALAEFRMRHPEASLEFANGFISRVLSTLRPRAAEWPASRHPVASSPGPLRTFIGEGRSDQAGDRAGLR
ncbi:hypothetical protein [Inquilinus sp.]|uniref:hypothetical protein n=1 Tax=Inquilinus sp. TaxID=1932117 RepID=UPI0031DAD8D4